MAKRRLPRLGVSKDVLWAMLHGVDPGSEAEKGLFFARQNRKEQREHERQLAEIRSASRGRDDKASRIVYTSPFKRAALELLVREGDMSSRELCDRLGQEGFVYEHEGQTFPPREAYRRFRVAIQNRVSEVKRDLRHRRLLSGRLPAS